MTRRWVLLSALFILAAHSLFAQTEAPDESVRSGVACEFDHFSRIEWTELYSRDDIAAAKEGTKSFSLFASTDDELRILLKRFQVISLCLNDTDINDSIVELIAGHTSIVSLKLEGCEGLTAERIKRIVRNRSISALSLEYCPDATATSFQAISQSEHITILRVVDAHSLTDDAFESIISIKALRVLEATGAGISGQSIKKIASHKLSQLRWLSLTKCKSIEGDEWGFLDGCSNLVGLALRENKLGDKALTNILKLTNLNWLDVRWAVGLSATCLSDIKPPLALEALLVGNAMYFDEATYEQLGRVTSLKLLDVSKGSVKGLQGRGGDRLLSGLTVLIADDVEDLDGDTLRVICEKGGKISVLLLKGVPDIGKEVLAYIDRLPVLKLLDLRRNEWVNSKYVGALKELQPDCSILAEVGN